MIYALVRLLCHSRMHYALYVLIHYNFEQVIGIRQTWSRFLLQFIDEISSSEIIVFLSKLPIGIYSLFSDETLGIIIAFIF